MRGVLHAAFQCIEIQTVGQRKLPKALTLPAGFKQPVVPRRMSDGCPLAAA